MEMIREKKIRLILGEQLYKHRIIEFQNRLYERYNEIEVCSLCEESKIILELIFEGLYFASKAAIPLLPNISHTFKIGFRVHLIPLLLATCRINAFVMRILGFISHIISF